MSGARRSLRALLVAAGLLAAAATAASADEDRVAELERRIEVLARELEDLRLGAAADTAPPARRTGLGPGASKVYASRGVSIGGYGEMLYENFDRDREDGRRAGKPDRLDFLRQIVYVGYKFSDELLLNSEIEIEHAGVRGEAEVEVDPATGRGEAALTGEVVLEFAYVEWTRRPEFGVRAGMLLVPVGLVNEMHEPTVFLGARRPDVERLVVPTTWRANGVGVHGEVAGALAYRAYLVEGLDAVGFTAASGIRGGRQSGSRSLLAKPAFAARVDYVGTAGLAVGGSAYTGDSWQRPQPAGARLAARVTLLEAHAALEWRGLQARALVAAGSLGDAGPLSDALGLAGADRLGERFNGSYVEAAYDLLLAAAPGSRYRLSPYARHERYDTQDRVPGGAENPARERTVWTLGLAFQPHANVALKADRQLRSNRARTETGQWNVALGYVF